MAEAARTFTRRRTTASWCKCRDDRGGKSSAMNWGLAYTQAEVIIVVDAGFPPGPSCRVGAGAADEGPPALGAVSGRGAGTQSL